MTKIFSKHFQVLQAQTGMDTAADLAHAVSLLSKTDALVAAQGTSSLQGSISHLDTASVSFEGMH